MTNTQKDGGPAFAHGDPTHGGDSGMTLRDYFAGQALQGLLARSSGDAPSYCPKRAWELADAMLAAREVTQPDSVRDELVEALEDFVSDIDGWSDLELARRYGPAEMIRFRRTKALLSRAKEAVK